MAAFIWHQKRDPSIDELLYDAVNLGRVQNVPGVSFPQEYAERRSELLKWKLGEGQKLLYMWLSFVKLERAPEGFQARLTRRNATGRYQKESIPIAISTTKKVKIAPQIPL